MSALENRALPTPPAPYAPPSRANRENVRMHLTNYAINKDSEAFVQPEDEEACDDAGVLPEDVDVAVAKVLLPLHEVP